MKLSVVIPVFNEEKTVLQAINKVLAEKTEKEIIIIDDGSTDETYDKIRNSKFEIRNKDTKVKILSNERNRGKGYSIRKGMKEAVGDVLIIQDADLEYDPNDYPKMLKQIVEGNAYVVYGSRLKNLKLSIFGKDKTPLPFHYFANRFLSLITNILYGSNLTDMETCYKMLSREVYKKLILVSDRFEIEPEITAKILKNGYNIVEVPIKTKPRGYKDGKKIRARDAFWAIFTLFKYRLID